MWRIMIIEDEESILEGLQHILDWNALNMQIVALAENGKQALYLYENAKPDIIVTDINMPVMDGLAFLREIREIDKRVRCIILSGHDEFEYARKAVKLDVEEYILKPIDEQQLEKALCMTIEKLKDWDRQRATSIDDKAAWIQFLKNGTKSTVVLEYLKEVFKNSKGGITASIMKISVLDSDTFVPACVLSTIEAAGCIKAFYLSPDKVLLLATSFSDEEALADSFCNIQSELETGYNILSFISVGTVVQTEEQLPLSYAYAEKNQKYMVILGYGNCVTHTALQSKCNVSSNIEEGQLKKMILAKNTEEAQKCIEDVFLGSINKNATPDSMYDICIKLAIMLQEMKTEYGLQDARQMDGLSSFIASIFSAENLVSIKTLFFDEITQIITYLRAENSHYTPIIKKILSEVHKNYKDDMSLKTLAYKYHMNPSYLGHIFSKEVGCSFSQFLNNKRNEIAKDLILNTQKRIVDISAEVGYPDVSYFYRKFKQSYGVSPASMREMKRY